MSNEFLNFDLPKTSLTEEDSIAINIDRIFPPTPERIKQIQTVIKNSGITRDIYVTTNLYIGKLLISLKEAAGVEYIWPRSVLENLKNLKALFLMGIIDSDEMGKYITKNNGEDLVTDTLLIKESTKDVMGDGGNLKINPMMVTPARLLMEQGKEAHLTPNMDIPEEEQKAESILPAGDYSLLMKQLDYIDNREHMYDNTKYCDRRINGMMADLETSLHVKYVMGGGFIEGRVENVVFNLYHHCNFGYQLYLGHSKSDLNLNDRKRCDLSRGHLDKELIIKTILSFVEVK